MKPLVAGILLAVVVALFASAAGINFWYDHRSYTLSEIPRGFEVGEDDDGPYSRSPRLQIRTSLSRERYLDWKNNQNLRRLGVIPALLGCGMLIWILRTYERKGTGEG